MCFSLRGLIKSHKELKKLLDQNIDLSETIRQHMDIAIFEITHSDKYDRRDHPMPVIKERRHK